MYGRARFPKRNLIGIDHAQMAKAKVAHGPRCGANVEWIARGHQHHAQIVEFIGGWHAE